jgi:uncharacterized membrane protein
MENFNKQFAIFITRIVGTMWCAYAFTLLALVSLPDAIHGGTATLVTWIAQTFLQLVLLSIIMVGQSVQSERSETRAEEDHRMIMRELVIIKDLHGDIEACHRDVQACLREIQEFIASTKYDT